MVKDRELRIGPVVLGLRARRKPVPEWEAMASAMEELHRAYWAEASRLVLAVCDWFAALGPPKEQK